MPSILVFSEQDRCAFELLQKARELGEKMNLEVAAAALERFARRRNSAAGGVPGFIRAPMNCSGPFDAFVYAQALSQIAAASQATVILIGSTRSGKELAGRLAQRLGAGCLTDCQSLEYGTEGLVATRNAFGGATVAAQKLTTGVQIYALMPYLCEPMAPGEPGGEMIPIALDLKPSRVKKAQKHPQGFGGGRHRGGRGLGLRGKGSGQTGGFENRRGPGFGPGRFCGLHQALGHGPQVAPGKPDRRPFRAKRGNPNWRSAPASPARSSSPWGSATPRPSWP